MRIDRGFYLDASGIRADTPPWILRRIVALARAVAVQMRLGPDSGVAFTAEVAGIILGLDTWWNNPNILYRANVPRKHKRTLPEVTLGRTTVPQVVACHVTGGLQEISKPYVSVAGCWVSPYVVILADSASREHPLQAFILANAMLARMCGFSKFRQMESQAFVESTRSQWLEQAEQLKGQRAYRTVRSVLLHADPGSENPVEAAAMWAMKCLLPPRKAVEVRSQHELRTPGGTFFLDLSLPKLRAAVETDGRGKYGSDQAQFDRQGACHINRHQSITSSGWKMTHVQSEEIGSPQLLSIMHSHLQAVGVVPSGGPPCPRGGLYREPNAELFHKDRRF